MNCHNALAALLALVTVIALPAAAAEPFKVLDRIAGPDGRWDYASVDSGLDRLYVARGDGVMAVDLASGAVTPVFVPGDGVHGVIPLGDGLAMSANGGTGTATLFEGRSGKVLARIAAGHHPDALLREPSTGLVLAMDAESGAVTLIDVAGRKAIGEIAIGGKLEFAAADGAGLAYVNVESRNAIAVVDVAARKVLRTIALAGCDEPTGLAYDGPDGLLIPVCASGTAKVIDAKDGREVASFAVGGFPDAAIFDPARRLAFVPSAMAGTLTVISLPAGGTPSVIQTLATQPGTRTGALDPATGRLYLPGAGFAPAQPGQRPAMVPGSFTVLVVGQ